MNKITATHLTISTLLGTCIFLTSCASIVSKSQWPVTINSNPSGTAVTIANNQGEQIHNATTPTTVTLKSGNGFFKPASYTLTFTGKGGSTHTVPIKSSMNGWYVGNLVFGGLIGILIVDPATGAMWKLQDRVTVDMANGSLLTNAANMPNLRIVERSKIPAEWESRLMALN